MLGKLAEKYPDFAQSEACKGAQEKIWQEYKEVKESMGSRMEQAVKFEEFGDLDKFATEFGEKRAQQNWARLKEMAGANLGGDVTPEQGGFEGGKTLTGGNKAAGTGWEIRR